MYPRRDEPRPRALRAAAIVLHAPMMVSGAHEPTRASAEPLRRPRLPTLSTPSRRTPLITPHSHAPPHTSRTPSPHLALHVCPPPLPSPHHAARSPLRNPPPRLGRCGVTGGQRHGARAGRLVRRRLVTRVRHVQRAAGHRAQHDGHQRPRAGKVWRFRLASGSV